jgi:Methyltransferase domain
MNPFDLLLDKIHEGNNPYTGFPYPAWGGTWYGDTAAHNPLFTEAIKLTQPGLIVEVGSFVGESAIAMAKTIKAMNLEAAILCVDTWYGSFEHWAKVREKIRMHFGRPDFYYKFLANVINHDCQDTIVPLAMDSQGAALVIKWLGLVPQLIFVDASHEEGEVFHDLDAYWQLLPAGGGMLVDDVTGFPGVVADLAKFCGTYNLKPTYHGEKALVIKQ